MALYNIYLENDAPGNEIPNPEKRRESWNDEPLLIEPNPTGKDALIKMVDGFVSDMIVDKFKTNTGIPKDELGLVFTLNKKVLNAIMSQENCEGIRIILASITGNDGGIKTGIIVKPVDVNLTELDEVEGVPSDARILFTKSPTECPPKNICTKGVVDSYFKIVEGRNK